MGRINAGGCGGAHSEALAGPESGALSRSLQALVRSHLAPHTARRQRALPSASRALDADVVPGPNSIILTHQ